MTYKKPICDCNKELIYSTNIVYLTQKVINNNGKPSKKKKLISVNELGVYDPLGNHIEHLQCPECLELYICLYDDKGRVIRGEKAIDHARSLY